MTVSGITLADGNATGLGGALSSSHTNVALSGVAIANNHAQLVGGGIYAASGALDISHSTISGNRVDNHGGGFMANYAATTLVDSTISDNSAGGYGGGFYARATVTVSNSTISGNTASGKGGGFWTNKLNASLTNSIVANNTASADSAFICTSQTNGSSSVTANYTLIEGSYACVGGGIFIGSTSNIIGQDPRLGPLTNNGGPTQTQALLPGSLAIDAGGNGACQADDQRGVARPYDATGKATAICDMGAFEVGLVDLDRIFANDFD